MTETIRVYVNGSGCALPIGASLLDAVRAFDPDAARLVETGEKIITDSRGLPVAPDDAAFNGAIVRVVGNRGARDDS